MTGLTRRCQARLLKRQGRLKRLVGYPFKWYITEVFLTKCSNPEERKVQHYLKALNLGLLTLFSALPPAQADIYFNAKVAGPVSNIYQINSQGQPHPVTQQKRWRDQSFDLIEGDDGQVEGVIFTSNRVAGGRDDQSYKLFYQSINSQQSAAALTQVDSVGHRVQPKVNLDNRHLAFKESRGFEEELFVLNRQTGEERTLLVDAAITHYQWLGREQIWVSHHDGNAGKLTEFTWTNNGWQSQTLFNPTNSLVSSFSVFDRRSPVALVLQELDSTHPSGPQRLLVLWQIGSQEVETISPKGIQVQDSLSWSPDGKQLLFSALVNYDFQYDEAKKDKVYQGAMHIFLTDTEGRFRQLTQGDFWHAQPTFSPDGQSMAFLFAKELGHARHFALKTKHLKSGDEVTLYSPVSRRSQIIWR